MKKLLLLLILSASGIIANEDAVIDTFIIVKEVTNNEMV